jgi:pumilio family protein 6
MDALLLLLASAYPSENPTAPHPIDLPHTSRLYKTLLQGGHFSRTTHSITRSPSFSPSAFASAFIRIVGEGTTVAMAKGDGAFVVAELLERVSEDGSESEKGVVRDWFKGEVEKKLEDGDGKGRKVLLEKVAKLG